MLFGALAPLAPGVVPWGATSPGGRLDFAGGLLFALALGGGLLALTQGAEGGAGSPVFLLSAGVALVAFVGFVAR